MTIAEEFVIKNPKAIIEDVQSIIPRWVEIATQLEVPENIISRINKDLIQL